MLLVVKVRAWRVAPKSQESSWLDVKKRSVKFKLACESAHYVVPNEKDQTNFKLSESCA
jgi:hypothetical protein